MKRTEEQARLSRELGALRTKMPPLVEQLEKFLIELDVGTFRVEKCGVVFINGREKRGFFAMGHPLLKCHPRLWAAVLNNIPEVIRGAEWRMKDDIREAEAAVRLAQQFLAILKEEAR